MLPILKKASIIAFLVLYSQMTTSQILITSDNIPAPGTNFIKGIDEQPMGIDPGSPGPGQTWDFSSLSADATSGYSYVEPVATPFPEHFPGANLALHAADTSYTYLFFNEETYLMQGIVIQVEGDEYVFDYVPDMIIMDFPFGYGDQVSQDYAFEYVYANNGDSVRIKNSVSKTIEADAFGIVTLPVGEFNALRVATTQVAKDSTWAQVLGNWTLIAATVSTTNYYDFYTNAPEVDIFLVSLEYDENWSMLQRADFFKDSFVGIDRSANNYGIKIYPNPSDDMIYIETGELSHGKLQLINIRGQLILEQRMESGRHQVDISSMKTGTYICRILDEGSKTVYEQSILIR